MLLTLALLAGGTDPAKGAAEAVVIEAKTENPAVLEGATELAVDSARSQLRAIGSST